MRLGWDEITTRARAFAADWADAHYEKGETQSFYNDFFEIFGVKRRAVATYEQRVKLLNDKHGFMDLFWPRTLLIEQKSARLDLGKAQGQALDYVDGIPERDQPRHILTCDFQSWRLLDLETGREVRFPLADLHKHVGEFAFILGRRRSFEAQASVTIKAAELMGRLHDALEASGYGGHDLERLLVQLLFCLFADDTGIFEPKDIFLQLIEADTREDGRDVGATLAQLFDVLNTPDAKRQRNLSGELRAFPYVNGALFADRVQVPVFDAAMRDLLLDACRFDWTPVSPAIFGSLFQSVMLPAERRKKGAHYTSEANIMKVIGPLFLDDLRADFDRLKRFETTQQGRHRNAPIAANKARLVELGRRLRRLTFFDPACGCGNFLVIAYRELRRLELDVLRELYDNEAVLSGFDAAMMSQVDVDQFHGIELEEFPAEIARVAMWMTDHIANRAFDDAFGTTAPRIPLKASAHILCADALEADWAAFLPPEAGSYILGNPPFVGFVMRGQEQQSQASDVMRRLGALGTRLDYVAAWFLKAGEYVQHNPRVRMGFVATNSLTQGEQVAQLWPALFQRWKLEIAFAHRTFNWTSEARGAAHVHVVIVGLSHSNAEPQEKRLFSYSHSKGEPVETRHTALTAYLFDAHAVANRYLVVERQSTALSGAPPIRVGTKPVDDGHFILDGAERSRFLEEEPRAERLIRPFLGGHEFINGQARFIIHVQDASPDDLQQMPLVLDRIKSVRLFRSAANGKLAKSLSNSPTSYHTTVIPKRSYLVIPEVSSSRREYVPIGWIDPPVVPSNKLLVVQDATLWHFGLLTSRIHMAWLHHIGGRLKSDYSYSSGLVYNTFPWPEATPAQTAKIEALAQAVLDARLAHPTSSLADLYDPDTMPGNLRTAHARLDAAVDRLYRPAAFATDRDRVEHLFGLYERMVDPLAREAARQNKRVARRAAADA